MNIFHAETRSYLILVCLLAKSIWVFFRNGITLDIFQTNSLHLNPFGNEKHENILWKNNSVCVLKMFLLPLYQKEWTCHFLWKLICWPFIFLPLALSSFANLSALFKVYLNFFYLQVEEEKVKLAFFRVISNSQVHKLLGIDISFNRGRGVQLQHFGVIADLY